MGVGVQGEAGVGMPQDTGKGLGVHAALQGMGCKGVAQIVEADGGQLRLFQQGLQLFNDRGEIEEVYAPLLGTNNAQRQITEAEKTWWTKITEFPIKARITLKGLLRPAMLMTHIRLNVYFYGRKHLSSGLYIVTKQVDNIGSQGFRTSLSLLRVGKADDLDIM